MGVTSVQHTTVHDDLDYVHANQAGLQVALEQDHQRVLGTCHLGSFQDPNQSLGQVTHSSACAL